MDSTKPNGEIYIVGDLNLFSETAARSLKKTPREYNKFVIKRLNECITENDTILLVGTINTRNDNETVELLKKINGTVIIDNDDIKYRQKPWNIFKSWRTEGLSRQKNYGGEDIDVIIPCSTEFFPYYTLKETNLFIAPTSMVGFKDKIKGRILNISFEALDYYPIELKYAVQKFEDIQLFESMNNDNEEDFNNEFSQTI